MPDPTNPPEKPPAQGIGPEPADVHVEPGTPVPGSEQPPAPQPPNPFGPAGRVFPFTSGPASFHYAMHPNVPDVVIVTVDTHSTRVIMFWPKADLERNLRHGLDVIGALPKDLTVGAEAEQFLRDMEGKGK